MAKKLYLIRHGLAVERTEFTGTDAERPLTSKGDQKTRKVAQRLKQLGLKLDRLFTSPLVRARQTAEILVGVGLAHHLEVANFLAPAGSFAVGLACLQEWQQSEAEALAFVGHEPDLSQWAELLLWEEARGVIALKKAGVIGLTFPEQAEQNPVGHCCLFWLTPPALLLDQ
jgi:phosphohistidine phosphatase